MATMAQEIKECVTKWGGRKEGRKEGPLLPVSGSPAQALWGNLGELQKQKSVSIESPSQLDGVRLSVRLAHLLALVKGPQGLRVREASVSIPGLCMAYV